MLTRPSATFNHTIGLAKAGDTIYVRGGTYMLNDGIASSLRDGDRLATTW